MTRPEIYILAIAMLAIGAVAGHAQGRASLIGDSIKCEIQTAMPHKPEAKVGVKNER